MLLQEMKESVVIATKFNHRNLGNNASHIYTTMAILIIGLVQLWIS